MNPCCLFPPFSRVPKGWSVRPFFPRAALGMAGVHPTIPVAGSSHLCPKSTRSLPPPLEISLPNLKHTQIHTPGRPLLLNPGKCAAAQRTWLTPARAAALPALPVFPQGPQWGQSPRVLLDLPTPSAAWGHPHRRVHCLHPPVPIKTDSAPPALPHSHWPTCPVGPLSP